MLLVVALFTIVVKLSLGDEIPLPNRYYSKVSSCLAYHGSNNDLMVSSTFECASACTLNSSCKSFSVANTMPGMCHLSSDVLVETGCEEQYRHFNKLELPCLNSGIYNATDDTCRCFHSYVGLRCERLMQDCTEGFLSGHYTGMEGMFFIHPSTSQTPIRVRCQMEFGGRTIIIHRDPDRPYLNFTRNWIDYKNGFGDMEGNGNFYIGNDIIHLITANRDQYLLFDAVFNDIAVNDWRQHFYYTFRVANESENYRLTYANVWVDPAHELGDCFPTDNVAFSTTDRDNDASTGSCAQIHQSGWWFDDCGPCNPLGELQAESETYQSLDPTSLQLAVITKFAVRELSIYLVHHS